MGIGFEFFPCPRHQPCCARSTYSLPFYHDWKRVGCRLARVGSRHVLLLLDSESRMYWYICRIRVLCVWRTGYKIPGFEKQKAKYKARRCRSSNPDGVELKTDHTRNRAAAAQDKPPGTVRISDAMLSLCSPLKFTCLLWRGACSFNDTRNYLQVPISTRVTQAGQPNMHKPASVSLLIL
jgi:hypothetical protein